MTPRTVWVHVGLPKAGSTSLQTFLMANRARLAVHGVDYPATGPYHHKVAQHVWARAMKGPRFGYWWMSADEPAHGLDAVHQALVADIDASPHRTIVLSAEELWHPVVPGQLARLFADSPWRLKILVYLRRQDDLLVSAYNQCVKTLDPRLPDRETIGTLDDFIATELADSGSLFRFAPLLDAFADAVGRENVHVRVFEKTRLAGGDLIDDALATLGVPADPAFERPARLNASVPQSLVDLTQAFNARNALPRRRQLSFNYGLRRLPEVMPLPDYAPIPAATRRAIVAHFAEGNAYVARTFCGRPDGRLFDASPPDDDAESSRPAPPDASAIACAVARIWAFEQDQLEAQIARRAALEAQTSQVDR